MHGILAWSAAIFLGGFSLLTDCLLISSCTFSLSNTMALRLEVAHHDMAWGFKAVLPLSSCRLEMAGRHGSELGFFSLSFHFE